ncbi:MAG: hypothetical protein SynsKO_13690 [Synoicihabitans sp.]
MPRLAIPAISLLDLFADHRTRARSRIITLLWCAGLVGFFTGCESTAPVTHRSPDRAAQMAPAADETRIAPLDIQLAELTASGAIEPHEEWTQAAREMLTEQIRERTGYTVHPINEAPDLELTTELQEVGALLRAMQINQLQSRNVGSVPSPVPPSAQEIPFDYQTGALVAHQSKLDDGAVLFIYLRDSYATGGRKALAGLGLVAAAFTGVYIAPTMGSTLATAALVDHDGNVLWMNQTLMAKDLRNEEGIAALLEELLSGLPNVANDSDS